MSAMMIILDHFDLIWFALIKFDVVLFSGLQFFSLSQKTEPSINLEQTTPCARAPAQNLLIRSVSLTTHETKVIEYKYFSRSICLLCLDPFTVREK